MESASTFVTLILAGGLTLLGAFIAMLFNARFTAKFGLIAGLLLLFGGSLGARGINLGIDLRGGTSLLYEVDTADVDDPQNVMQQTVQVLQERVDPQGVRNLNWILHPPNRIEIQMPMAGDQVVERRAKYQQLLEEVDQTNISRDAVLAALRLDEQERPDALRNLAEGVEGRLELLQEAAEAQDALQAARQKLEGVERGTDQYIQLSGEVAQAEIRFDEAVDAVMATNLDQAELGRILEMPSEPQLNEQGQPIEGSSPRAQAIQRLKEQHPQRQQLISQVVEAYDAYEQVKGPLDDPNDLMRLLRGAGVLEFRIAVNEDEAGNLQQRRQRLAERGPRSGQQDARMRWFRLDNPAAFLNNSPEEVDEFLNRLQQINDPQQRGERIDQFFGGRGVGAVHNGEFYILLWDTDARALTKADGDWEISGSKTTDDFGRPAVAFDLGPFGGNLMGELTSNNVGRQMAIVLDGRVYSAPNIEEAIRGQGRITGRFTDQEVNYLVRTLNAGALQARLSQEPISVRNIGPSLGQDNLESGLKSAVIALIVVAGFMLVYFFAAGLVADLALMANLVLILGVMATLQATFTLPGIAGVVLTIGMAVDANVLIFERIREELNRGAKMGTALRLGYEKAFSSIFDGNITNLIVCAVLYNTATAEVKGFAVTLGIGILATLFTSLFMTRAIYQLYDRLFGMKDLKMLPRSVPAVERLLSPGVDWIGKRKVFFTISATAIVLCLSLAIIRGQDILDIQFRGGTEVTFNLAEGEQLTLQQARDRLQDTGLGNYNVVPVGDVGSDFQATSFSVMTTETDQEAVADAVRNAFSGMLDIQPAISFENQSVGDISEAPVYPITQADLGQVINRSDIQQNEVPDDFLGGVAIVLNNIQPAQTTAQLEDRIDNMRLQPDFENLQFRPVEVIGLSPDPTQRDHYTSAVVVSQDPSASYFDNPEAWASSLAGPEWDLVREGLGRETTLDRVSNFSASVARTMANNAIVALLLSIIAIVAYIWFRFGSLRYGLAAIAALVHDVMITLGLVALSAYLYDTFIGAALLLEPFKINMGLIAALLTIIGYSLNDTIVLFDRIRENRGKLAVASPDTINDSINQVISRTVLTSLTTFLAVGIMYVFGGSGIHNFAFALVVGVIVGTYSSIAVAAPLLLIGTKYQKAPPSASRSKQERRAAALNPGGRPPAPSPGS